MEDDEEDELDLLGSDIFAFSIDDAISVVNVGSAVTRRWLLLSKLKQGLSKYREKKNLFLSSDTPRPLLFKQRLTSF